MKAEKGTATISIEQLYYYRECEKAIKTKYFRMYYDYHDSRNFLFSMEESEMFEHLIDLRKSAIKKAKEEVFELKEKLEQLEQKTTRKPWYKIWPI